MRASVSLLALAAVLMTTPALAVEPDAAPVVSDGSVVDSAVAQAAADAADVAAGSGMPTASELDAVAAGADASPAQTAEAEDPFLWLEDIEGERAMAWVNEQNARTLGVLQSDPRYQTLHDEALALVQARDRIPQPGFNRDGTVDNFWQDAEHVRGIWRTTTLDSYRTAEPQWETVLDFDALATSEGKNWVYKGATCLEPDQNRCLIFLSDGGKDAVTTREYDRAARAFVQGGFELPESKSDVTWIDENTLLIGHDFGEGSMTDSGYPRTVRLLRRGQPLDQATLIYEGQQADVAVSGYTLRDADGALRATLLTRGVDFYNSETFLVNADGTTRQLELPAKASISGLVNGQLVVTVDQEWTAPSGQSFETGDVIAWDLDTWLANPAAQARLIVRPTDREAIEGITTTRDRLIVQLNENVRGTVRVYTPNPDGEWGFSRLALPENMTIDLGSSSESDNRLFLNVTGYLTPSSLWLADASTGQAEAVKTLPAKFDASGMVVEQFEARSADGTMIPYFVVRNANVPMDGSNPTLLYGYGGYEVSLLPGYSAAVGKLWLERGGVYVVANTRGGGEFGPRWHQAAQQQNRQRAHEDFQAVALNLIERGITSQPHLGIMGGSQGGLFMGAMLTQRPDLINGAVIQVPLFDMLRFHRLLAGASWIAEYGNPDIPEQRAWIEAYSPYQRLAAGQPYPEVFIHTSTKDDRVHPGHARKAVARLEELGYPVLYYENTDGGHAAAANLRETARRLALEYTYLSRRLMDTPAQE